ncbi:MAG: beta-ketoacyl-[acyl-carrier-protein] synthase family protein [Clostridiales bacterium]|nr:beta-ketoacyl-[acyl-carrier-protein] synthase family protein [Clostridiales bacterium]
MTRDDKRCVITGLGMICAIGNNVDECWANALHSTSGIAHTKTVDTVDCYTDYAAEVRCADLDAPHTKEMDRVSKLCIKATAEAMADAGLKSFDGNPRCSVIIGSCVGGVVSIEKYYTEAKKPEYIKQMPISAIASQVAGATGAGGVVTNVANACAAGTISIAYASDLIRNGKADIVVAGGADAFASVPYAGFISLHALASDPCSPFNHSSGLTLGEGSGIVIVESYEHAKARGAKMYCEVLGSGISSDAHHITAPRPDGEGQMSAIRRALRNSGVNESDIGYVNAHGTGTSKNDEAEFLSLHTIFDGKNKNLSVSSTKAMTGHCLGAAGAIEAVFAIKALTQNTIPPTVGYSDEDIKALADKAGDMDFCPNKPHAKQLNTVMSNSFAFGGNNASIVFGKDNGDVRVQESKPNVYVTGIGAVTPLGNGVPRYLEACANGEKIEGQSARSSVSSCDYDAVGLKMAFYRKLDRFSQLQAVSGMQALINAEYAVTADNAADIGIIVGTSEGALGPGCDFEIQIADRGNAAGSAFKFPNTVYNAAGGYLSICSGIKGYNVTVTNGAQSGLFSIAYAADVIRSGEEKAMLASGTDENSDIMDELYRGLGLVAGEQVLPYAFNSQAFALSDGSVSVMLESDESATARNAKKYCRIAGTGSAHSGVQFGTLIGSEKALDIAITDAVKDAGLALGDIDAVIGFANGHKAIDRIELDSYGRVFGAAAQRIPVISVKERMGEGRASAAALAVAHGALILHGDIKTETSAFVIGKDGKAARKAISCDGLKNILVTSFGAGGSYCAVILTKD